MSGRTYGGGTADDRLSRRRRQLLDAGLELFGTAGHHATTVRQICREAKVSGEGAAELSGAAREVMASTAVGAVSYTVAT